MNSKLLFAATVAISVISSVAMADEAAPLTRAQVQADLNQAIATHTLQRTDYDALNQNLTVSSDRTRKDVLADLASDKAARKALSALNANRTYNPYGLQVLAPRSTLTRAEVKADVVQAAANGTLRRSDYDDMLPTARRVAPQASATLAQRIKAVFSHS